MYTFLFISKIHPNTGNKGSKSKSSIKSCYISLLRYMFLDGPIPNCNEGFNNSFWFYCNFFLKVSSCSEDKTWIWKKNTLMIFAICIPFSVNTETLYTYVSVISSQIFLCLLAILFLFSLYLILQTTEARMYIKGILHLSLLVVLQYGFFFHKIVLGQIMYK